MFERFTDRARRVVVAKDNTTIVDGSGDGEAIKGRINQVLNFKGLERVLVDEAVAGDIVLINGIEDIGIGVTVTAVDTPEALPMLTVDEPTLTMNFMVNNSPLAGREGKFVTSRQLRERLERVLTNDPGMGVIRHVDAGYDRAVEVADERGVRIPMRD